MSLQAPPAPPHARTTVAVFGDADAVAHWSARQEDADRFRFLFNPAPEDALAADHAVVLRGRSVEQSGPPADLRRHPVSEHVLRAFGPVNLFKGKLEFRLAQDGGRPVFCSVEGEAAQPLAHWLSPAFDPEAQVQFFVRVEDTEVGAGLAPGRHPGPFAAAHVIEVAPAGTHLTLRGEAGETWSAHVLTDARFVVGQRVFVSPRVAYVFPVDYQI